MIPEALKVYIKTTLQELIEIRTAKLEAQLEGQWEHIRNLEKKLLNPSEY